MSRQGDHLDFTSSTCSRRCSPRRRVSAAIGLMFATNALLGRRRAARVLPACAACPSLSRRPRSARCCASALLMPQVVVLARQHHRDLRCRCWCSSAAWMLCDPPHAAAPRHRVRRGPVRRSAAGDPHRRPRVHRRACRSSACVCWSRTRTVRAPARRVVVAVRSRSVSLLGVALGWFDLVALEPALPPLAPPRRPATAARRRSLAIVAALSSRGSCRHATRRSRSCGRGCGRVRAPAGWIAAVVVLVGGLRRVDRAPAPPDACGAPNNAVVAFLQSATHLPFDPDAAVLRARGAVGGLVRRPDHAHDRDHRRRVRDARVRAGASCGSRVQVVALVLGPPALLYLWRPSITPDQIWATRRFVPAVLPIIVLAAFGVLCAARGHGPFGFATARRVVAVVLGVAAIAYPAARDQQRLADDPAARLPHDGDGGVQDRRQERCDRRPAGDRSLTWLYDPQTLRSFCNVPVAIMLSGQKSHVRAALARRPARCRRAAHARAGVGEGASRSCSGRRRAARTINKLFPGRSAARCSRRTEPAPAGANAGDPPGRVQAGEARVRDRARSRSGPRSSAVSTRRAIPTLVVTAMVQCAGFTRADQLPSSPWG